MSPALAEPRCPSERDADARRRRRSRRRASGSRGAIYETPCAYSPTLSELTRHAVLPQAREPPDDRLLQGARRRQPPAPARPRRARAGASSPPARATTAWPWPFTPRASVCRPTIVMPAWAPLIKVTSARRHGAEVILSRRNYDEAYARRPRDRGASAGSSSSIRSTTRASIAGQGTLGLELLEQLPDLDAVVVPVGGGGLIGGVGLAIKARAPARRASSASQAEALPAMQPSLAAGRPRRPCRRRRRSPTASRCARWAS